MKGKKRSFGLWYRFYVSVLDDPKIEKLSDAVYRTWTKLNAVAVQGAGLITGDIATLSIKLRKPEGKVREHLQILLSAGLLDRCGKDYTPHDWEQWQFDSDISTSRVKEFRERSKSPDETEKKRFKTGDETDLERPHSNREQKEEDSSSLRSDELPEPSGKRRRGTSLPSDFPDSAARLWGIEFWQKRERPDIALEANDQADQFRDYHTQKQTVTADWAATWRTWARNAMKFTPKPREASFGQRNQAGSARQSNADISLQAARNILGPDGGGGDGRPVSESADAGNGAGVGARGGDAERVEILDPENGGGAQSRDPELPRRPGGDVPFASAGRAAEGDALPDLLRRTQGRA